MPRKKKAAPAESVTMDIATPAIEVEPKVVEKVILIDRVKMQRQGTDLNPVPPDVFQQAQSLVIAEKRAYEDSNRMLKQTVTRAYKNYTGVFDQPVDPYTRRPKIFTPLTHTVVDSITKPVKVDARSIKILPITEESRGKAKVLNMVLPYFLQQTGFDDMMSLFVHRLGLFGAQVTVQDWEYREEETVTENEPTSKTLLGFPDAEKQSTKTTKVIIDRPRIRLVNVLDIFCPATAETLPWAVKNASVILRSVVNLVDVQGNPTYNRDVVSQLTGWTFVAENIDDSTALNKYGMAGYANKSTNKSTWASELESTKNPFITIYTRFGRIPKSWVTGKKEDQLIMVPGIIDCASNNGQGSDVQVLSVRLSPFGEYGPFEEAHYNKLPNRWMGEGVAERLIPLQVWQNEIVNSRRNNELLVQQRMFKYKKGSVDPSQLYSRPAGGIPVENMADLEWMPTPDVAQSSFAEDSAIESSAQRLAGAALTPVQKKLTATEAQTIQANSGLTYNEIRDTIEAYLERLVTHHIIPLMQRYFESGKTIPIEMPISELEMLDTFNGYPPMMTEAIGRERFLLVDDGSVFQGDFAVTADIEAATTSKEAQAAALTRTVEMASKIQNAGMNFKAAFRKIAELQGIVDSRLFEDASPAMPTGVTNANPAPAAVPGAMMPGGAPQMA